MRSLCNLRRTSAAECDGNLKSATDFKQGNHVVYRNAVDEPKPRRGNVNCSLCVVQRIRFIGPEPSQLARELRGVFATGKLMQNPCPIVFGIGVIGWLLPYCDYAGRKNGVGGQNVEPEVIGTPSGIARVFDCHGIGRIVLAIQESRQSEDAVAVGTSGIAAKGNGKQLQGAFLLFESESVNSPEDLVFTERCREDFIRRGNRIGGPERIEAALSIAI